ncbi:hypothetical protein BV20DRAFT_60585 [Pilatotrama ljubarskyi]|nr:hypothetical protein BV20DRAFT_60585 [Pilatotrama ljubarskyi]
MVDPYTVFDIVVGVVGLLAIALQYLHVFIKARLPSSKLRVLEETLEQTQSLLDTCVEEGRLRRGNLAADFQTRLNAVKTDVNQVRIETLAAKTYFEDLKNMLRGLSRRTDDLREQVTEIRVQISLSSADSLNSREETEGGAHPTEQSETDLHGERSITPDTPGAVTNNVADALQHTVAQDADGITPPPANGTIALLPTTRTGAHVIAAIVSASAPTPLGGTATPEVTAIDEEVPPVGEDKEDDCMSLSLKPLLSSDASKQAAATRTYSIRRKKRNEVVARTRSLGRRLRRTHA